MAKVLVVEDDPDLCVALSDSLTDDEHHTVEVFQDGQGFLDAVEASEYDVIVLDWDLPDFSGVELLKKFRSGGGMTPVIMLTGKSDLADKALGLDSGADDYLTKPFHLQELAARIRSLLRRPPVLQSKVLHYGDLSLDPVEHRLTRGGEELRLTSRDFALLEFFMRHPTQIFSGEALLTRVWNYDSDATLEGLRVAIRRIRKVVDRDDDLSTSVIENVARVGYRLRSLNVRKEPTQ
ncbi:MAG: response regulator transcription factor [Cyanobacteria bacterium SZAS-4]|nr:response regulator transcription factor [Cyanobacteria bacterium SZAS-4]